MNMRRSTTATLVKNENNSLRAYAKRRILTDMVNQVRRYCKYGNNAEGRGKDEGYIILVLDKSALKVFSSCCQLWELMSISKIYQIEKLENNRKQYKKTDVIYFITPTADSIARLCDDFKKEKFKPKYNAVHLCFTSHVSAELMEPIAKNELLVKRICSFFEINIDFYMFNDSVFHIGMKN